MVINLPALTCGESHACMHTRRHASARRHVHTHNYTHQSIGFPGVCDLFPSSAAISLSLSGWLTHILSYRFLVLFFFWISPFICPLSPVTLSSASSLFLVFAFLYCRYVFRILFMPFQFLCLFCPSCLPLRYHGPLPLPCGSPFLIINNR